jgi:solute carrier family 25 (mitochondrial S-adenosylmethionine transporter), member 26
VAGTAVDTVLFPLDAVKTRLQSGRPLPRHALWAGAYAGLRSAVAGSAPTAALFFVTYDGVKRRLRERPGAPLPPLATHMMAASLGEMAACIVRVPTDALKQRMQVGQHVRYAHAIETLWRRAGVRGFYVGLLPTLLRDVSFHTPARAHDGSMHCQWPKHTHTHMHMHAQADVGGWAWDARYRLRASSSRCTSVSR